MKKLFVFFLFAFSLNCYSQVFRDSCNLFLLDISKGNLFRLMPFYSLKNDTIPYSTGFFRLMNDTLNCYSMDYQFSDSSRKDSDTAYYRFTFYSRDSLGETRWLKKSNLYDSKGRKYYSDSLGVLRVKKCKMKDNILFLEAKEWSIVCYPLIFASSQEFNSFVYIVSPNKRRLSFLKEPLRFKILETDARGIKKLEFLLPYVLGKHSSEFLGVEMISSLVMERK
jgi:hypothetical protein